ncbi:MAG: hypothetical protein WBG92_01845 [Thiohalocapsa sp.]
MNLRFKVWSGVFLMAVVSGGAMGACPGNVQITDAGGNSVVVTFSEISANGNNKGVTVDGLSLTRSGNAGTFTATDVAAAYANRTAGTTYDVTVTSGSISGTLSGTLGNWSSGPASGTTVTFSSSTAASITTSGTANVPAPAAGPVTAIPTLATLLTGNTVCVGDGSPWEAQEYHQSGGTLIDWKQGATDPIDPTEQVGSWAISGTGTDRTVDYTYGSTTYINKVYDNGNDAYSFCNNLGNETVGTIETGQVDCSNP